MGLLSMKNENNIKFIDIIDSKLNDYNYKIFKLYSSNYEVPQIRRRVIYIGFRKDLNIIPEEPKKLDFIIPVKNILQNKNNIEQKYYLSKKAIDGINKKKENMKTKKYGFGAQFLNLDKPSYTITSRYYKDGYDALVKYSDSEIRRLTILELKRIQTFPDDYNFCGNNKDIIIQIGNAVPCKLAYHIICQIISQLKNENN